MGLCFWLDIMSDLMIEVKYRNKYRKLRIFPNLMIKQLENNYLLSVNCVLYIL